MWSRIGGGGWIGLPSSGLPFCVVGEGQVAALHPPSICSKGEGGWAAILVVHGRKGVLVLHDDDPFNSFGISFLHRPSSAAMERLQWKLRRPVGRQASVDCGDGSVSGGGGVAGRRGRGSRLDDSCVGLSAGRRQLTGGGGDGDGDSGGEARSGCVAGMLGEGCGLCSALLSSSSAGTPAATYKRGRERELDVVTIRVKLT